jgi:hypothetical protein
MCRAEHIFLWRQRHFFFKNFKNTVAKGTFTILGGHTVIPSGRYVVQIQVVRGLVHELVPIQLVQDLFKFRPET